MFVLWKDHTAVEEAEEITAYVTRRATLTTPAILAVFIQRMVLGKNPACNSPGQRRGTSAASWIELCDWVPALLSGTTARRIFVADVAAPGINLCGTKLGWPAASQFL